MRSLDYHCRFHNDFSKVDNYRHCYAAKRQSKCGRHLADETWSRPNGWFFIDQELQNRAHQFVHHIELALTQASYINTVIARLMTIAPQGDWVLKDNHNGGLQKKIIGYELKVKPGSLNEVKEKIANVLTQRRMTEQGSCD